MRELTAIHSDTVDVADVVRTLRVQWRAILSFLALGVLGALAVILFAPRRYDGKATVLARTNGPNGTSVLGRMTGVGDLLGGMGGLGGSPFETELQLLRSRALGGQVVDSLMLQFRVRDPAGIPPTAIIASHDLGTSFAPREYRFERQANGSYRVAGDSVARTAIPGHAAEIGVGMITLRLEGLPRSFELLILDRDDAITRLGKKLEATKAGGEVAKISYRGEDRVTAAAVPNALVHFYLERRRTVDRGTNQRRVEYVQAQVDSTAAQLASAERDWRRYQEGTRVYDADISDKAQVESAAKLRESLIEFQVDEAGIKQLLAQADKGTLSSRDLAAYPALSHLGSLVNQLSELEVQRTRLLERRTERDPEVLALDQSMKSVNATIASMARSYATAITRRRVELEAQLDSVHRSIMALPAAGEKVGRLKRDVVRLTEIYTALQAQLVEARLGAIGEGGDVRQIDVAAAPRNPAFPQPFLTMGIGTAGGLFAGIVAALFLGWFGRWLRDPIEVERAIGIAAERFQADAPLLVAGGAAPRTVLVIPLDDRAQARVVAERLARTATARSLPVTVLDLSANGANGKGQMVPMDRDTVRRIDQLEQENGVLVVQLPSLSSDATLAALRETRPVLLVAPPGPVDRARLAAAVETLRRLRVPCAGIVMSDEMRGRPRSAV
jgi:uncharacterized protein involved in exopolysaccharide biosynthesis